MCFLYKYTNSIILFVFSFQQYIRCVHLCMCTTARHRNRRQALKFIHTNNRQRREHHLKAPPENNIVHKFLIKEKKNTNTKTTGEQQEKEITKINRR